ncbi:MAG: hypothetical protein Kapaf2KO_02290 [Candidatus Kapaibacteriales bacterium]
MDMQFTDFEKITAFLDGELQAEEVGDFFMNLHQDKELQQEFLLESKMKNLDSTQLIKPPVAAREEILSAVAVGFSPSLFLMKPAIWVSTFLVGALSFLGFYNIEESAIAFLGNSSDTEREADIAFVPEDALDIKYYLPEDVKVKNISQSPALSTEYIKEDMRKDDIQQSNITTSSTLPVFSVTPDTDKAIEVAEERTESESSSSYSLVNISEQVLSPRKRIIADNPIVVNSSLKTFNSPSISQIALANPFEGLPLEFTAEGMFTSPDIAVNVSRADPAMLNNISFGLFYKFDQNWAAGAEIGREDFHQVFEGVDKLNRVYYRQVMTADWAALALRYMSENIHETDLKIIGKASLGGTQVGAIGGLEAGLRYDITDNMAFQLLGGGNILLYRHQNSEFFSSNYGVSYGIVYTP